MLPACCVVSVAMRACLVAKERRLALDMRANGASCYAIGRRLQRPTSTITRFLRRGGGLDTRGPRIPRATVTSFIRLLRKTKKKCGGRSTVTIAAVYRGWHGRTGITLRTLRARLQAQGVKVRRPIRKTILSREDEKKRKEWAATMRGRTAAWWKNTVVLDATYLRPVLNEKHAEQLAKLRHEVLLPGERRVFRHKRTLRFNTGPATQIWAAAFRGEIFVVVGKGTCSAEDALRMYKELKAQIAARFPDTLTSKLRLFEDNDRVWKAQRIVERKKRLWDVIRMPPRSPDVMVWDRSGFAALKGLLSAWHSRPGHRCSAKQYLQKIKETLTGAEMRGIIARATAVQQATVRKVYEANGAIVN